MRQFRIDDSEKDRILNLHESATKRQYLSEQVEDNNLNKAIQCFLNKKNKIEIEVDGKIGPKTIDAIGDFIGYERTGDFETDWSKAQSKMSEQDKKDFKDCVSKHGDLFDKIYNWLF